MPNSSRSTDSRREPTQRHARRRRSFGRMSDQEMRVVFESLEPRSWLMKRKRWVQAAIAVLIAICALALIELKMPRHGLSLISMQRSDTTALPKIRGYSSASNSARQGTPASAMFSPSQDLENQGVRYESPLDF